MAFNIREDTYYFTHLLHMPKTSILATKVCKILLASRIALRLKQLRDYKRGSTSKNHTFDADAGDFSLP